MAFLREFFNKPFMYNLKTAFYNPGLIIPFIRRRILGQTLPPITIMIKLNEVCNARCRMCNLPIFQTSPEFSMTLFKKLIDDVKSFKPTISFKMTEPTLKRDLCDYIKLCTDNGLKTVVTTNGFLLPKVAEGLIKAGLTKIQVSIDDIGAKHDNIRRLKGCFKNAVLGIEKLVYFRKKYNSKLKIFVNFTIFEANYMSMIKVLEYFEKYPIEYLKFQHLNFPISEIPKKIDAKKLYNIIQKIKKRKNKVKVRFLPDLNENELYEYYHVKKFLKGFNRCFIPYTNAYVDYNGDVMVHTRCIGKAHDFTLGNIKQQKFPEIWKGEKYRKFREMLNQKTFKECMRCCGVMTAPRHLGGLKEE